VPEASVLVTFFVGEARDLVSKTVTKHLAGDLCAFNYGSAYEGSLISADEQYVADDELFACGNIQFFYLDKFILTDGVLLTAGF
jgi:hypothetical protein